MPTHEAAVPPVLSPTARLWRDIWWGAGTAPGTRPDSNTTTARDSTAAKPADTILVTRVVPPASSPRQGYDLTNILILDFFTGFSGAWYHNSQNTTEQHNNLYFYYNLSVNNTAKFRKFSIRLLGTNEYGLRLYQDSIAVKADDRYQYRIALTVPVWKKRVKLQTGYTVRSQLWKTYAYREDDGERYLYADYFTPGYTLFNAGVSFSYFSGGTIDVGLVGGKLTKMRNEAVYESRGAKKLYGLERGERRKVEYGLSLQTALPVQKINDHLYGELAGNLFVPKDSVVKPHAFTYDANAALHFIFLKHIRLTLRTQLAYDPLISTSVFMMNGATLGFYLNNKI